MMLFNEIFRVRVAWLGVLFFATFVIASMFLTRQTMTYLMNTATLPIAVAVIVSYAPAYLRTIMKPGWRMDGPESLSLGIALCWIADAGLRTYSLVWNAFSAPPWLVDSYTLPFLLWLNILGGINHITAPGAMMGEIPTRNLIWLGIACGGITLLIMLSLWFGWFDVHPPKGTRW